MFCLFCSEVCAHPAFLGEGQLRRKKTLHLLQTLGQKTFCLTPVLISTLACILSPLCPHVLRARQNKWQRTGRLQSDFPSSNRAMSNVSISNSLRNNRDSFSFKVNVPNTVSKYFQPPLNFGTLPQDWKPWISPCLYPQPPLSCVQAVRLPHCWMSHSTYAQTRPDFMWGLSTNMSTQLWQPV